ncbi:MAG: PAS domain S-box protein [Desulfuromonadales bacterium]|nr:PAS domain S-box protein [Desulfuromonadales bacterium]
MKAVAKSIRVQLFLMAVIIALPAAGLILHSGIETRREATAEARIKTQTLADNIAFQQQFLVTSTRQLLSGLAQLPDVHQRNREKVEAILTHLLSLNPQYLNIFISDRQGNLWASAIPSSPSVSCADQRFFINAMASGQFSSGESIVDRILRKPTLTLALPFKDEQGEPAGVIAVNFDLGYCDQLLESSRLPDGANFLLTDHAGVVLSRGVDPSPFVGKPVDPAMLRQMDQAAAGTFISQGFLDGIRRFVTYRKLYLEGEETPYLYVRTSIPVEAVLARANMALFLYLGLLSTVLLFGFALAWVVGNRLILEPVARLRAASQRLAGGDFRVRVAGVVKGGELGELGESFDTMAAELQQQQETLKSKALVLENMAEGVSECDVKGRILFTNPAFDAMFGYGKGELIGREMQSLLEDASDQNGEICGRIRRHLQQSPLWCGELQNRRQDGSSFPTYVRISKVPESGRFISVQEDITERKKLERLKDEMISAVSHEMRTPLTALLGYHEFLAENTLDQPALTDALATMHKETRRLDGLIENFLDLQRIKSQQMAYAFEPVKVEGLLQETAALFTNASRNHRIIVEAPPELPPIQADKVRLQQVMNNLVSNAIKYSPGRCDIVLGAKREGDFVSFWVRDKGIGIPAEAQVRIFDRFYRLANPASGHPPGTGLGLALVREIVENHGGHVRVESIPGEGSTFFVAIPLAPALYATEPGIGRVLAL